MKVIGINASPRKKANTQTLIEAVLDGAAQEGAQTRLVNLRDLAGNGCVGCEGCKKKLGHCVQKDELSPLLREMTGYDAIVQAEGGMMGITGPAEGPPSRVGVPIIDITSGMFAASAILAALYERVESGQGQLIDISLMDTQVCPLSVLFRT